MIPPLRDDQVQETLRRYGLYPDTPVLGIRYEHEPEHQAPYAVVNVPGMALTVPQDVLAMPAPAEAPFSREDKTLFERPEV